MTRYHSNNISPADVMILFHVEDGVLTVTDWKANQVEYNLPDVIFEHELDNSGFFAYFSDNGCLIGEAEVPSETFDIRLPHWNSDGQPLVLKAWVDEDGRP